MFIFYFSLNTKIYTQDENDPPLQNFELKVRNQSVQNRTITARIYPVSMVFNGNKEYRLDARYPLDMGTYQYNFINGRNSAESLWTIAPNAELNLNHDQDDNRYGTRATLGFGIYKLEIKWGSGNNFDTCTINYDAGYPGNLSADIDFEFRDNTDATGSGPRVVFKWGGCTEVRNISQVNRKMYAWDQCSGRTRDWDPGNIIYNTTNGNNRILLPQDFRQDCPNENYPNFTGQYGTGLLTLNLTIDKDIRTRLYTYENERFEAPTQIVISSNCTLTINSGKMYEIKHDPFIQNEQDYYNKFYVKSNAHLRLNPSSQLIIENTNWLVLECHSKLILGSNSKIILQGGSKFCNRGATMQNSGQIVFQGIVKPAGCSEIVTCTDNIVKDSVKFIIEHNASLEIPDSTTYIFEGTETALFCKDSSEIKFGKGSKLVFQDGARINANGCRFVSYDSTDVWDGIYLDGIAYDTLKNCTFQNAVNGINITDNYDPFGSPGAVEISNCTFKNSTSSDLLNYVYVNNSYNVLIKGCNSEKTGSGGFTAGIIVEYCPTNGVVIADNNINYVTTGISLLQSSEYIGRNTITGSTNSGTGIYLDNSNGTIEYNTVNNFQKSVYGSYSSPYMLKNTLSNAYVKNIDLASNSYPVMKPVVSGSTLRWLGGNNTITGTPSNSGIAFADCYPLIDSGYNRITVNGSDYMNGNFTFAYTTVNAKINYWYDNPPNSSLFDISGGNVNYADPFDGSTLPSTDGTELNSIGWGLYDTVFTKSFGDNSTPEDLFMQAYTEEMSQNYTDAITHFKEVVSSYKTSSFAPVSLSRIFNCLEKSNASNSDYQTIQTYYNSIKSNSAYPNESRVLAEDFVIKSKVRQGNVEEATNDYKTIYQSNQNNSKGLHALLNKLCLENMIQGDNSSSNTNYQLHKMNLLSLITGENIRTSSFLDNNIPKQFRLLQNYPNPFNPVTNIRYEIPKDINVSIKIYDLLGREVFSINEYKKAGSYEVQFDGTNFASGMYFYKMVVGELRNKSGNTNNGEIFTDTKKMVLLK